MNGTMQLLKAGFFGAVGGAAFYMVVAGLVFVLAPKPKINLTATGKKADCGCGCGGK